MVEGRTGWLAWSVALVLSLAGCGGSDDDDRGQLVESAETATLTQAQVDASVAALPGLVDLIGGTARCGVSLHKLVYTTITPQRRRARASMGVLVPSGCASPFPTVLYHHGTQLLKSFRMSDPANLETFLANAYFASQGYVVLMPDYLGYGDSDAATHPYLDANSMGETSVDAVRAARRWLAQRGTPLADRLFLTGYSQGGHSTLATQRRMEADRSGEFKITASAPMAGFYALTSTFVDAVDTPTDFATVLFAYGVTALQKNYGDVYTRASDAFQPPYDATVESLLPGTQDLVPILTQGLLPQAVTGPGGLLTDGFAAALRSDPNAGVRRRLAQNDLTEGWTPKAPTTLCHGGRDTVVPAKNMTLAAAAFSARGADVTAIDLETIPPFKAAIDAQLAAAGTLQVYHAQIAPPLCFSVVKNQVFDPRR